MRVPGFASSRQELSCLSRTAAALLGAGFLCIASHASAADAPPSELDQVKRELADAAPRLRGAPAGARAAPCRSAGASGRAGRRGAAARGVDRRDAARDPKRCDWRRRRRWRRVRWRRRCLQPGGLAGARRHLRQSGARPGQLSPARLRARPAARSARAAAASASTNRSSASAPASIRSSRASSPPRSVPTTASRVEEAWFQSSGLVEGTQLRVGRFLSGIGYLNEQHAAHVGFRRRAARLPGVLRRPAAQDGAAAAWVAPTDRFVELGAEIGNGDAFPGSDGDRNGVGSAALFAHLGDDIGESDELARRRCRCLGTRPRPHALRRLDAAGSAVSDSFDGSARTLGARRHLQVVARTATRRRPTSSVQGEYFRRRESGRSTYDAFGAAPAASRRVRARRRAAGTCRRVYQFMPAWRVGARYDRLDSGAAHDRTARGAERGSISRAAGAHPHARHGDGRLLAVGVQPLPPAVRAPTARDPASPTTSSSCNTS